MKLDELRARHPRLIYRRYDAQPEGDDLRLRFTLVLEPNITFVPDVVLPGVRRAWESLPPAVQHTFAFHLGLVELPSYWKAACPPVIRVEAGPLDARQVAWWHDLLLHGMTEFFFVNQLDFTAPDFVRIEPAAAAAPPLLPDTRPQPTGRVLVPIGGGKDSVVTLETLRQHGAEIGALLVNPMVAARDIAHQSGAREVITIRRRIDPALLQLNAAGYLNGHTPFSAVIGTLSVVSAALAGYGRVAVSNERSSNEGNVWYREREINHQYSKSFDFERKFRAYLATYLAPHIDFFSFVRPLYELQITRLFARHTAYHPIFRSCNKGLKANSWCHQCPKCLFVYTALYPFLSAAQLGQIFSEDIFLNADLAPLALQMVGLRGPKPFECVGTSEETLAAFALCLQRVRDHGQPVPPLLQIIEREALQSQPDIAARAAAVLASWNDEHAIPTELVPWLRAELAHTDA